MGDSIQGKKGAVDFIEGRLKRNLPMSLFHDEWRSCIDCEELADIVIELFSRRVQGLYHCGGPRPVSLFDIGKQILEKRNYNKEALKIWSRHDDINGPPRIGNVHLNSHKMESLIGRKIKEWIL
jgi:dTDP-4-dehydrorhamnose reductase